MSTRRTKTFRRKEDREYNRWFAREVNEALVELDNSDTHKTFNTVEELFADLDSDD